MNFLILYLIIINAIGCIIMLRDKYCAVNQLWRIPEKALLFVAIIGGSLGSYLGMKLFRHKTKHPVFYIGLPVILALHCIVLLFIFNM